MKKPNVIIVHGAYGHPEENWFGWLKRKLTEIQVECVVPALPTPTGQELQQWLSLFDQQTNHTIHENTILIGHSLGAVFVLRWLEQHQDSVATVILVGTFMGKIGNDKFDVINESFFSKAFDWEAIRSAANHFIGYHGTNDPYVAEATFEKIVLHLKAQKIVVANGGHFNTESGYSQFPHLLRQVKQLIEKNVYE